MAKGIVESLLDYLSKQDDRKAAKLYQRVGAELMHTVELHSDIVNTPSMRKPTKANIDRLHNCIGWYCPENTKRGSRLIYNIKEQGLWWTIKSKLSSLWFNIKYKTTWEVTMGDGVTFSCGDQIEAEVISFVAQINERLKRMEK